jgi:hypothetical protein
VKRAKLIWKAGKYDSTLGRRAETIINLHKQKLDMEEREGETEVELKQVE